MHVSELCQQTGVGVLVFTCVRGGVLLCCGGGRRGGGEVGGGESGGGWSCSGGDHPRAHYLGGRGHTRAGGLTCGCNRQVTKQHAKG